MKKYLHIILASTALAVTLIVCVLSEIGWQKHRRELKCTGLRVCVADSSENRFLSATDIVHIIDKDFGGYTNRDIARINLNSLEQILEAQGYITSHEAYFTTDGKLNVLIRQMTPSLKIRKGQQVWYMDNEGRCIKVKNDWCDTLVPMSGDVLPEDAEWVKRVAAFISTCQHSATLNGRIKELKCYDGGKILMLLGDRDEVFDFGAPMELKGKFRRMDIYEKKIRTATDKAYKKVNLKYNGQIVCK